MLRITASAIYSIRRRYVKVPIVRLDCVTHKKSIKDFLQVAIDVSGNGQLPWPPVNGSNIPTFFRNVTLFLTSYALGYNFTISNATNATGSLPFLDILQQEPGSTVKHVNWIWPLVRYDLP